MRAANDRWRSREWLEQNAQIRDDVVERIQKEGPLGSADFKAPVGYKRGYWWDWKPAKKVLETLFNMGEMMITERRNFHRIYDLTERVLPEGTDTTMPDEDEMARFRIRSGLGGSGFAGVDGLWWGPSAPDGFYGVVEELVDSGEIMPVEIKGLSDTTFSLMR